MAETGVRGVWRNLEAKSNDRTVKSEQTVGANKGQTERHCVWRCNLKQFWYMNGGNWFNAFRRDRQESGCRSAENQWHASSMQWICRSRENAAATLIWQERNLFSLMRSFYHPKLKNQAAHPLLVGGAHKSGRRSTCMETMETMETLAVAWRKRRQLPGKRRKALKALTVCVVGTRWIVDDG